MKKQITISILTLLILPISSVLMAAPVKTKKINENTRSKSLNTFKRKPNNNSNNSIAANRTKDRVLYKYALSKGNRYFLEKNYKKALVLYEIAIANGDNIAPIVFYRIGSISLKEGEIEKAIAYFKLIPLFTKKAKKTKGPKEDGLAFKTYYALGKSYKKKNDYIKALEYFKKALRIKGDDIELTIYISSTHIALNNYDRGVVILENALVNNLDNFLLLFSLGNAHYKQGKLENAIKYYKKALELKKKDLKTLYKLGLIMSKKRKWRDAVYYLEQYYYAIGNKNIKAVKSLAHALIMSKNYSRALAVMTKFKDRLHFLMAIAHFKNKEYHFALEYFLKLIRAGRKDLDITSSVAFSYFQIQDYYNAIFYYKWSLSQEPSSLAVKRGLAFSYFENKFFYKASIEFLELIEMKDRGFDTFLYLGRSYIGDGKYSKAKKVFSHMLKRFKDYRSAKILKYLENIEALKKVKKNNIKEPLS